MLEHFLLSETDYAALASRRRVGRTNFFYNQWVSDHNAPGSGAPGVRRNLNSQFLYSPLAAHLAALLRDDRPLRGNHVVLRSRSRARVHFFSLPAGLSYIHVYLVHHPELADGAL